MPNPETRPRLEIEPETLAKVREVAPKYNSLTADELRQYADHIGAEIRTRMSKPQLVKAVAKKAANMTTAELYAEPGGPEPEEEAGEAGEVAATDPPDPDAPLTQDEIDTYRKAIRQWGQRGYPEKCAILQDCIDRGVVAPAHLLFTGDVQPEKSVRGHIETPPRMGRGATKAAWQEFLLATADMEPEVIERLSRDDCIATAEAKGIIPRLTDSPESE